MFEKILSLIERYDRIIIHRHTNPDGDAIGSQVGLKHLILGKYPEKEVYMVGDSPKRYSFIEDSTPDEIPDEYYADALAIILDTSSPELISDTRYTTAKESARLDHHIFIDRIAGTEVVDTSYESCCGLVAELAIESGYPLDSIGAKALYTGMVTDSGRFRYDSTDSDTHRRASFLMKAGFDTTSIYKNLYSDELSQVKFRASFVMKIRTTEAGVAYIYTTLDEFRATGRDAFSVSRGMVSTMSDIKGIDIWVNFTETENGVLTEIRSSKYNINPIAVKYGGGGHAKASGATLESREQAMAMLSDLDELMGEDK